MVALILKVGTIVSKVLWKMIKVKPDAVFCGNDYLALGVLQYLHEKNISVPENLV